MSQTQADEKSRNCTTSMLKTTFDHILEN